MRLRTCFILVGVSLTLIVAQQPARAMCTLLPGGNDAYFEVSAAVFLGRATALRELSAGTSRDRQVETTFDVDEIWKGTPQAAMRVRSSFSDGEGFVFTVGTSYLVWAVGEPLGTSACELTHQVDSAGDDLLHWLALKPSQRPSSGRYNVRWRVPL